MVSAPWFSNNMASCFSRNGRMLAGSSSVDGVAYLAVGILPQRDDDLRQDRPVRGIPATVKAVATGGWACRTARTSGLCR